MKNKQHSPFIRVLSTDTCDENGFSGVANVMGVIDSYRSVFYPGAYSNKVIDKFKKDGFITYSHVKREAYPVGMIKDISTQGYALMLSALFHKTDDAQELRQICMERMENGQSVGLSVGGFACEEIYFKNGKDLLAHANGLGRDLNLFDTKSIEKVDNGIWGIPDVEQLTEVALTFQPAVPGSDVAIVKSLSELNRVNVLNYLMDNLEDMREPLNDLLRVSEKEPEHNIDMLDSRFRMLKLMVGQ